MLALLDDSRELQHAVREGRLAVVDVRDDAEVPNVLEILRQSASSLAPPPRYSNVA